MEERDAFLRRGEWWTQGRAQALGQSYPPPPLPLPLNPTPYNQVRAAQEIAISPPASPDASPRVDRVSPTTTHGDLGHLAC